MTDPLLPTASELLTPYIDAVISARPGSLAHFNTPGDRWSDLPAILRAQILVNLSRLGDEVLSCRLKSAKALALRQLCASEFNTVLPVDPQTAYATVTLTRPAPIINGTPTPSAAPSGVIKQGTLFSKQANPSAQPLPIKAAQYKSTTTLYVPQGQLSLPPIILEASSPGAAANVPQFVIPQARLNLPPALAPVADTSISISQPQTLFDPTFTTQSCTAAGGSSGLTDPVLVAAAKAYAVGQFGPTDGALLAGILQQQSVRHYAVFPAVEHLPYSRIYVADESWGSASGWYNSIGQTLSNTPWLGFGARARFGQVVNQQIVVAPNIVLQSTDDLNYTADIDANVRAAAEDYFNNRPYWWLWKLSELQALLSMADDRILQCPLVSVTDAVTGNTVPEAVNAIGQVWSPTIVHPYLIDANVQSSYFPPS